MRRSPRVTSLLAAVLVFASVAVGVGRAPQVKPQSPVPAKPTAPAAAAGVSTPEDYVIGPEDVLGIQFWRDESMSGDAVVRPDGMITLRLLNDIRAAGLTTMQLREVLMKEAARFLEDPQATVLVKQLNSRWVTILGEVGKPGRVPLNQPMTVLAALGMVGGPTEFAKADKITILRTEGNVQKPLPFDYKAILNRRKLEQNIFLKPGDTITVP